MAASTCGNYGERADTATDERMKLPGEGLLLNSCLMFIDAP